MGNGNAAVFFKTVCHRIGEIDGIAACVNAQFRVDAHLGGVADAVKICIRIIKSIFDIATGNSNDFSCWATVIDADKYSGSKICIYCCGSGRIT